MNPCDDLDAFHDDELPPAQRDAFLDHLADCPRCQAALEQHVQLDVAVARWGTAAASPTDLSHNTASLEPAPTPTRPASNTPPSPASRTTPTNPAPSPASNLIPLAPRRLRWLGGVAALAAVAAAVLLLTRPLDDGPPRTDTIAQVDDLQLPPTRVFEPRLTYALADRHRPYEVLRSNTPARSATVPLAVLTHLQRAGDTRGLASALALNGELARAEAALPNEGAPGDRDSDLAALHLAAGRLDDALARADAALLARPDHPQARWNRGLILRALDLPLTAAAEFDRVAAAGEPGWSDEARALAESLRRDPEQRERTSDQMHLAGPTLLRDGTPLPDALVAAAPGQARAYFYDALRAAPTRERLLALRPLAGRLDARTDASILQRQVDLAAEQFRRRAPHSATYAALAAGTLAPAELDPALRAITKTDLPDLMYGALIHAGRVDPDALTDLAERTGDPWLIADAARARGQQAIDRGDLATGEELLVDALAACRIARVDDRCARVADTLASLYLQQRRLPEAEAQLDAARAVVLADVQWDLERTLLQRRAALARLRGAEARAQAHDDEARIRDEPAR